MSAVTFQGRPIAELLPKLRGAGYQIPRRLNYRVLWEMAVSGQISVRREGNRWFFDEGGEAVIAAELGLERAEAAPLAEAVA